MIRIGTVTGSEIKKNRDGQVEVVLLQVQMTNAEDIQTIQLFTPFGEDDRPIKGSQVVVVDIGPAFKVALAVNDGVDATMAEGEKKIYSLDESGIKGFINLLNSGIIEINGSADFAVRFNALQTAFDELKAAFNTHLHTNPEGGNVGPAVPQSAADITAAKVSEVKLS